MPPFKGVSSLKGQSQNQREIELNLTRYVSLDNNPSLKQHVIQKLEISGPLGTQSILIPADFDLLISVKNQLVSSPTETPMGTLPSLTGGANSPEGDESRLVKQKQTIIINVVCRTTSTSENPYGKKMFGTLRALVLQMLIGVSVGFVSHINLKGVGYKGFLDNNVLSLNIGFGHPIQVNLPHNVHVDPLKIVNSTQGSIIPVFSNSLTDLHNFVYKIYKIKPIHKSFKEIGIKVININRDTANSDNPTPS